MANAYETHKRRQRPGTVQRALAAACPVALGLAAACFSANAEQVLLDHPPFNTGGPASDTEFDYFGIPYWQLHSDDFKIDAPAAISKIKWWGFYNLDNPPDSESFQVRICGQRSDAALPGAILFTAIVKNLSRSPTGRIVVTGIGPREFLYSSYLETPFLAEADVPYWLEIAQVEDPSTLFRWEYSVADRTGSAFLNPDVPDWTSTLPAVNADHAFQLITPEPASAILVVISAIHMLGRRRERAVRCRTRHRTAGRD